MVRQPASEHTEIESKLVVVPARRREVVAGLRDLEALAGARLIERPPRDQHDRYFDTPGGDLGRHDVSFRLRSTDDRMVVTVKGPTEILADGALARLEVEDDGSPEALARVLGKLRGWGVPVREPDPGGAPEIVLESAGLFAIHRRTVRRVVRDAVPPGTAEPVAEVVLDAVSFEVGDRRVLHEEIEIEGRGPAAEDRVREITAALVARFGDALRRWLPSKLALGLALDALERDGALAGLLDAEERLTPAGYDAALRRIEAG